MTRTRHWLAAAAAVAALQSGLFAQERTEPAKPEEKTPAIDPKDVRVGPPPELAELRKAVEEAARKGENVEEIRKQLEALEKALAGKAWVKPKPVAEEPPPRVNPREDIPRGRPGIQPENLLRAQELMMKAARLRAEDPAEAERLLKQARELLGDNGFIFPPRFDILPAPIPGRGSRLGIRVEEVTDAMRERLQLPDENGILAAEIVPDSPAEKAGLKAGDVILEFAGKPVGVDPTAFVRTVQGMRPGAKVDIVLNRRGKKEEVKGIQLADLAERFDPPRPMAVPIPVPLNPRLPGIDVVPLENKSRTVRFNNDEFRIIDVENGVRTSISGKLDGEKLVPAKISVSEGRQTAEAESVEKLPAEHRARVQKILEEVKAAPLK